MGVVDSPANTFVEYIIGDFVLLDAWNMSEGGPKLPSRISLYVLSFSGHTLFNLLFGGEYALGCGNEKTATTPTISWINGASFNSATN